MLTAESIPIKQEECASSVGFAAGRQEYKHSNNVNSTGSFGRHPLGQEETGPECTRDRGIKMSEHMGGDANACSLWSTGALLTALQVCWVLEFMIHKMHGISPVISKLRLCEDCIILNENSPSFWVP